MNKPRVTKQTKQDIYHKLFQWRCILIPIVGFGNTPKEAYDDYSYQYKCLNGLVING